MSKLFKILKGEESLTYYSSKGGSSTPTEFGQRSIKYGNDEFNNGSSNQPYIQTPIPEVDDNSVGIKDPSDVVIRGGVILRGKSAFLDAKRLGKWFTTVQGAVFVAKQNLLERQQARPPKGKGIENPLTSYQPTRIYNPLNTFAQLAGNVVGLHFFGKGLLPWIPEKNMYISQMGVGGRFNEVGVTKPPSPNALPDPTENFPELPTYKYGGANSPTGMETPTKKPTPPPFEAEATSSNRLGALYISKILKSPDNEGDKGYYGITYGEGNESTLFKYSGGPNSIGGFGKSIYQRVTNTTNNGSNLWNEKRKYKTSEGTSIHAPGILRALLQNKIYNLGKDHTLYKIPNQLVKGPGGDSIAVNNVLFNYGPNEKILGSENGIIKRYSITNDNVKNDVTQNFATYNQALINKQSPNKDTGTTLFNDFRKDIVEGDLVDKNSPAGKMMATSSYEEFNRFKTYGMGNPGQLGLDRTDPYGEGIVFDKNKPNATNTGSLENTPTVDRVNWSPMYHSTKVDTTIAGQDLVPFYIAKMWNGSSENQYIHFRAFIDNINDSFQADWSSYKFLGRGDNFYTYNGFDRAIGMSFKIHAQSQQEMKPLYDKLNYLVSSLAPDYGNGFMRGNMVKLTIGDYLHEVPGIIKNITIDIPSEYPWDIARKGDGSRDTKKRVLPMLLNVSSFSFVPIYDFLPSIDYGRSKFINNR